jgi:hypothetical protein
VIVASQRLLIDTQGGQEISIRQVQHRLEFDLDPTLRFA